MTSTSEYEQFCSTVGEGDELCWALGLTGEAGEVAELIKKRRYHGGSDKKGVITSERILNECGDVLWYLTAMLLEHNFTLEDCMKYNMQKLEKRFPGRKFSFEAAHAQRDEECKN